MVFFRGNDTLKAGPLGFTGAQRRQEVPPHFTFQSSGGCDFLPHFQSDNIRGWRREGAMVRERRRGLRGEKDASVIDLSPVCVSTQLGNSIYRNDTPPSLSRSIRCFCEISTANGFNPNELRFRNLPPPCFSKVK